MKHSVRLLLKFLPWKVKVQSCSQRMVLRGVCGELFLTQVLWFNLLEYWGACLDWFFFSPMWWLSAYWGTSENLICFLYHLTVLATVIQALHETFKHLKCSYLHQAVKDTCTWFLQVLRLLQGLVTVWARSCGDQNFLAGFFFFYSVNCWDVLLGIISASVHSCELESLHAGWLTLT